MRALGPGTFGRVLHVRLNGERVEHLVKRMKLGDPRVDLPRQVSPSPGADVGGVGLVPVLMWDG